MSKTWFVKVKGETKGPVESRQLQMMAAIGVVTPETPVSLDGQKWSVASKVKGLEFPSPEEPDDSQGVEGSGDDDPLFGGPSGASFGFPEAGSADYVALREAAYVRQFGPFEGVCHQLLPVVPHIDVYVHPPHGNRRFATLVTGGMSDRRMQMPPGPASPRAELLLYVDQPTDEHVNLLRFLAQIPMRQNTWYSISSTMTNGNPPRPIFEGSALDCYLFMPPIVGTDGELRDSLRIEGDPVEMLWAMPITSAERQFNIDKGFGPFLDLLDKKSHPPVLDPKRKCYVTKRGWFG